MPVLYINNPDLENKFPHHPEELINYGINNNITDKIVIVVPTGRMVYRLKNYAVQKYYKEKGKPFEELKCFTFMGFVEHAAKSLFKEDSYSVIGEAYQLALFKEASEKSKLKFYSRSGKLSQAILERLYKTIYGLKEDGIRPADLREDLSTANPEVKDKNRLEDVARLYEQYENILSNEFFDEPALVNTVNAYLTSHIKQSTLFDSISGAKFEELYPVISKVFSHGTKILFYGFSEFKKPEEKLLKFFARSNLDCMVYIDYDKQNGPLFGNFHDTNAQLINVGFQQIEYDNSNISDENLNNTDFLRKYLFNTQYIEKPPQTDRFNDIVKIIEADDRQSEVRRIAALVKYLKEKGVLLYDICITMRQPQIYTDLFRDIFRTAGIQANISDRFSLQNSSVAVAIFSILEVIVNAFNTNDLHRALQSPYFDFNSENDINVDNLYDVARKLRISGGRRRRGELQWKSRLLAEKKTIEAKIKDKRKEFADSSEIKRLEYDLKSVERAEQDFEKIYELLHVDTLKSTVKEFADYIKENIFIEYGLYGKIIEWSKKIEELKPDLEIGEYQYLKEEVEKDAQSLKALISILDEMVSIIEKRKGKDTIFSWVDLTDDFRTAVSSGKYQIKEKRNIGVNITSIEQSRGIPYKVMILCGAVNGEFPISYKADTILGKELDNSEKRHRQAEKVLFYQFLTNNPEALNKGDKQIFITYPLTSEDKELVRSQFVDVLLNLSDKSNGGIPIISSDNDENMNEEQEQWIESIITKSELIQIIANNRVMGNEELENKFLSSLDKNEQIKISKYLSLLNLPISDDPQYLNSSELADEEREFFRQRTYRPFSVSDLEKYAKCPYQYYVNKMLDLSESTDYSDSITPLELGNLFHEILYRFYTELSVNKNNTLNPIKLDSNNREEYKAHLIKIAEEEIDRLKFDHPFFEFVPAQIIGNKQNKGYIEVWLDYELSRIDNGWLWAPALFEYSFGMPGGNNSGVKSDAVEIDGKFKLRGKIDRIELSEDKIGFFIADYKTRVKKVPGNNDIIKKGHSFQAPMYILAAKEILKKEFNKNLEPQGAVYYGITPDTENMDNFRLVLTPKNIIKERDSKGSQTLTNKQTIDEALDKSKAHAFNIIDNIAKGEFPIEPVNDTCKYCSFQPICRKEKSTINSY